MNIAIVGSNGYISGFLLKYLNEININKIFTIDQSSTADAYLNLSNAELFDYNALNQIDYIIFTAAISGPDKCATDFDNCWKVNVTGTKYFIHQALNIGCKVLFFSSDAVFGNSPGMIYNEMSITKAVTAYGKMKKSVEDEFQGFPSFKSIRLSYVVSVKDKFVSYCIDCIKQNKEANIFHPFYRNCIVISDVIQIIIWLLNHFDEFNYSVLNAAGIELVSRVRIADEINRASGGKLKYKISKPDDSFFKNRPCITQMQSLYLQKYQILEEASFTAKFQKELKEIELWSQEH